MCRHLEGMINGAICIVDELSRGFDSPLQVGSRCCAHDLLRNQDHKSIVLNESQQFSVACINKLSVEYAHTKSAKQAPAPWRSPRPPGQFAVYLDGPAMRAGISNILS